MGREGIQAGNNSILGLASCVCRPLLERSWDLYFQKDDKIGLHF